MELIGKGTRPSASRTQMPCASIASKLKLPLDLREQFKATGLRPAFIYRAVSIDDRAYDLLTNRRKKR